MSASYDREADARTQGGLSLKAGETSFMRGMSSRETADFEEARTWYERSLALGNVQAGVNLGYLYCYGRLGAHDYARAFELWDEAARKNHPEACYKLGDLYAEGHGCPLDAAQAFELYLKAYRLATADGDAGWKGCAAFRLARCYDEGRGCSADPRKALERFAEAERCLAEAVTEGYTFYEKDRATAQTAIERLRG